MYFLLICLQKFFITCESCFFRWLLTLHRDLCLQSTYEESLKIHKKTIFIIIIRNHRIKFIEWLKTTILTCKLIERSELQSFYSVPKISIPIGCLQFVHHPDCYVELSHYGQLERYLEKKCCQSGDIFICKHWQYEDGLNS